MARKNERRGRKCALCFKAIRPGDEYVARRMFPRVYCGESCQVADDHRFGRVDHYIPDPRFHRVGDGWRGVVRFVNAKVAAP